MSSPDGGCPVCGRAAGPDERCAECGWVLRAAPRPGPVTDQLREDFTVRLNAARQRLDVRVAARISADPEPYRRYIRGGPPDSGEWAAARRAARQDAGDAIDDTGLRVTLSQLLAGLRPDTETTVVEVGHEGITVTRISLDRFGSSRLDRCADKAWTTMLPMLSTVEPERYFQLAGAISALDRLAIWSRLRSDIPDIPAGHPLVICRLAGWLIPEWAASVAARPGASLVRTAGTAASVPALTLLGKLAAEAPLRCPYQLLVAVIDAESGAVETRAQQLFPQGAEPGAESRLSLRSLPGDHADTTLAVFAGHEARGEPLALFSATPPTAEFELHAVLAGPGRVQIVEPADHRAHLKAWAEVRESIPDRVDLLAVPADLVCAIDLSGPNDLVSARRRLIRRLLEILATEYPESAQLRVAVLTCTDHHFQRAREYLPVVQGKEFGPALDAQAWLSRQTAADELYPLAAPVEDLLHEASLLLLGSRQNGRAARLLTVAGRRPHPYPQGGGRILRCPLKYQWREIAGELAGPITARCVAVTDAFPRDDTLNAIWRDVGPAGLHALPDVTPQLIAEDLGLLVKNPQRIPVPLLNPE